MNNYMYLDLTSRSCGTVRRDAARAPQLER